MSPNSSNRPLPELVPEQEFLTGYVSTVIGPIEFRVWKNRLERIDDILGRSDVEKMFQRLSLRRRDDDEQRAAEKESRQFRVLSAGEQAGYHRLTSQALRCHVVQALMGEDFRGFSCRLAESPLLQWVCKMDRLDAVRIPGKSALQRYSQWLAEADMRKVIDTLLVSAAESQDEEGNQKLKLAEALNLESYFLDTTCVKLNIHYPVDWVLLRDAARTLMKATMLIRKRGLKVRMDEPEEFLKRMNQLCIRMTHARRKKDGKRVRKAVLREMKKLSKRIRMVVEKLPAAIRQAHERIIGERQVENDEKILSLYEEHASVYVRGKAGAEVEFGSQLLLGESQSGVIVDWELVGGKPQADTKMLQRSLERMQETAGGPRIRAVGGDRGFDSKPNRAMLEEDGIYNAICPKAPEELQKRMKDGKFVEVQKRRSQTEARISIFKNGFLGSPLLSKGHANQEREVAWNVLAHNLWVIARQPRTKPRALAKAS